MKVAKSIFLIINYKTFIVTTLAVLSTWLCNYFVLQANFPLTIIGIAIVFPVVFSIDSAYKRRERTLMLLSDFKAHLTAIHLASQQWVETDTHAYAEKGKELLLDVYSALQHYCIINQKSMLKSEKTLDDSVKSLSSHLQGFRHLELPSGEVSRINQYLSKVIIDIENIKVIRQYRTPVTLRAYSKVFIYSFPIIYGPYFMYSAQEYSHGLEYFMPVIFSFILVSLDNIQEHLENPFDQIGEDDVKFDVESFSGRLS
ncbi:hypothetical protein E1176_11655 [Fulvivirga sp. RKSG066]|uniref:hypothetical protein n=1 Tax=Fulvivirga aurantia TaxID=2529383 RepID=UPI0012BBF22C|nr:hypothetical protein [Fulvivirga aurantia]MTI21677.1 hypothetical protein [Fulvivirga aurantia]